MNFYRSSGFGEEMSAATSVVAFLVSLLSPLLGRCFPHAPDLPGAICSVAFLLWMVFAMSLKLCGLMSLAEPPLGVISKLLRPAPAMYFGSGSVLAQCLAEALWVDVACWSSGRSDSEVAPPGSCNVVRQ